MPQLSIELFGAPRIVRDGHPVEVDTRKAIALLAYLAITRIPHTRDSLATLLYPEADQERARGALRRTLSTLRTAVGDLAINATRDTLALADREEHFIDVIAFRNRLAACQQHGHPESEVCIHCLGPLQEAAALYKGDFLAGFTLRDSPSFDDWQFMESDILRREAAGVLRRLSELYSRQGEYKTATDFARRWLAFDPLQEIAHQQLMRLAAWAGQRPAALRQYRECVRILDSELGVAPLEETTRLYQAILEDHLALPEPLPVNFLVQSKSLHPLEYIEPKNSVVSASLPLVGRLVDWEHIKDAYQQVSADLHPKGHWLVIEGEAGIGKTRLAEEFLETIQHLGARVIRTRCYSGEQALAFVPLIEGLRNALMQLPPTLWPQSLPGPYLADASRLLPELLPYVSNPTLLPLDSPGSQSRFFESLCQVISALLQGPLPGVFFVDDLHWADEATLNLLAYLARRLENRPLLIIVTWQETLANRHPALVRLADEMRQYEYATHIHLSRLGLDDIASLFTAAHNFNRPSDQEASFQTGTWVNKIFEESEGLPFFVIEYLNNLQFSTRNSQEEAWPIPAGVRSRLKSRLATLDETSSQMLQAAAVIGRSFGFDTLRMASGRSEEETITAVESLLRNNIIREANDATSQGRSPIYDFAHFKMRDLVYEDTALVRRRLLHRRVATALVERSQRQGIQLASQIARHFQLAGEEAEAAVFYTQAGEYARSLFANETALGHYQTALALGHPSPAALHLVIGDLQTLLGNYSQAMASFETAAALASPDMAPSVEFKLGSLHTRRGDWLLSAEHFQIALSLLGKNSDPGFRSEILANWSYAVFQQGAVDQAQALSTEALALAQSSSQPQPLAYALNMAGILAYHTGQQTEAAGYLEESLAIARDLSHPASQVAALNNLAYPAAAQGNLDQALQFVLEALRLCRQQGDRHREAALLNHLADLYHAAGCQEEAMAHVKQAVSLFAEIGSAAGQLKPEIWKLTEW